MTFKYNINSFTWESSSRTFFGVLDDLYPTNMNSNVPFPNNKKKFIIHNPKTEGFRVYSFVKEISTPNSTYWLFISEDSIKAMILTSIKTIAISLE